MTTLSVEVTFYIAWRPCIISLQSDKTWIKKFRCSCSGPTVVDPLLTMTRFWRTARILFGVHFFPQKKLTTFLWSSPSKDGLKLLNEPLPPPNLPRPAKNVLKIDFCSACSALCVLGCTYKTNFPCKLRLIFFSFLGV